MGFALNTEGIAAIKSLVTTLTEGSGNITNEAHALQRALDANRSNLSSQHSNDIENLVGGMQSLIYQANTPISELSGKLTNLASRYQEIIDMRLTAGASGASNGTGNAFGGGSAMSGVQLINGPHTAAEDAKATNPGFDEDWNTIDYNYNCQRCVPAWEARRRGYNVQAKPIPQPDPHKLGFGRNWASMYKDPKIIPCSGDGLSDIETHMEQWGDGARAEIRVGWHGKNSGHVFVAERIDGKVRYLDPQNGKEASGYFGKVRLGSVEVVRIDNLEFTDAIKECFTEDMI